MGVGKSRSSAVRFAPLAFFGSVFLFSILLHAFGPVDWNPIDSKKLYIFLFSCLLALVFGYSWATRSTNRQLSERSLAKFDVSKLMYVAAFTSFALYPGTTLELTGSVIPNAWMGLTDPGLAYKNGLTESVSGSMLTNYLRILLSPLLILVTPITIFCYQRLTPIARILGISSSCYLILIYVALGRNKAVFDLGALVMFAIVVSLISAKSQTRRIIIAKLLTLLGLFSLMLTYFTWVQRSRMKQQITDSQTDGNSSSIPPEVDLGAINDQMVGAALVNATSSTRSSLFEYLPDWIYSSSVLLTSYLTQGYKALDIALNLDFVPSWGLGFSDFFTRNYLRISELVEPFDNVEPPTYASRVSDFGWEVGQQWGTFFIYPASDISFFLVPPLMGLIGIAWGLSWMDTLKLRDPLASAVFASISILIGYLSANNQVFQSGETAVGFTVITMTWMFSRFRRLRGDRKCSRHLVS